MKKLFKWLLAIRWLLVRWILRIIGGFFVGIGLFVLIYNSGMIGVIKLIEQLPNNAPLLIGLGGLMTGGVLILWSQKIEG